MEIINMAQCQTPALLPGGGICHTMKWMEITKTSALKALKQPTLSAGRRAFIRYMMNKQVWNVFYVNWVFKQFFKSHIVGLISKSRILAFKSSYLQKCPIFFYREIRCATPHCTLCLNLKLLRQLVSKLINRIKDLLSFFKIRGFAWYAFLKKWEVINYDIGRYEILKYNCMLFPARYELFRHSRHTLQGWKRQ